MQWVLTWTEFHLQDVVLHFIFIIKDNNLFNSNCWALNCRAILLEALVVPSWTISTRTNISFQYKASWLRVKNVVDLPAGCRLQSCCIVHLVVAMTISCWHCFQRRRVTISSWKKGRSSRSILAWSTTSLVFRAMRIVIYDRSPRHLQDVVSASYIIPLDLELLLNLLLQMICSWTVLKSDHMEVWP